MDSTIPGNLLATAMIVMPHTDAERALEMTLGLDVPFWPQLPNYIYHEDMYVQAAEHFPGIIEMSTPSCSWMNRVCNSCFRPWRVIVI